MHWTLSLVRRGDLEAAVHCGQQALEQVRTQGPQALHAQVLAHLSLAFERSGLAAVAAGHAEQALVLARACGDVALQCSALIRRRLPNTTSMVAPAARTC
ncbi:MAG: hypothetical protein ACK5QH_02520 [Rubrivivax sp.]